MIAALALPSSGGAVTYIFKKAWPAASIATEPTLVLEALGVAHIKRYTPSSHKRPGKGRASVSPSKLNEACLMSLNSIFFTAFHILKLSVLLPNSYRCRGKGSVGIPLNVPGVFTLLKIKEFEYLQICLRSLERN